MTVHSYLSASSLSGTSSSTKIIREEDAENYKNHSYMVHTFSVLFFFEFKKVAMKRRTIVTQRSIQVEQMAKQLKS